MSKQGRVPDSGHDDSAYGGNQMKRPGFDVSSKDVEDPMKDVMLPPDLQINRRGVGKFAQLSGTAPVSSCTVMTVNMIANVNKHNSLGPWHSCVSAGTWVHAGYHLGTTIAVPAAVLPLPYAFSQLTWAPGIIALLLAIGTTTYSSYVLAGLFNWNGKVYYRYRDLVRSIFGEFIAASS